MRWPFRYRGEQRDREGKEMAKQQLEVAKHQLEVAQAIREAAAQDAQEHHRLQRENHFKDNIIARALEVRRS